MFYATSLEVLVVGAWRYSGKAIQAVRLQAARSHAGFETARDAAQQFGWSQSRYRSHEGAIRGISDAALREYSVAFGISEDWLRGGDAGVFPPFQDENIQIDPIRERQLELRIEANRRDPEGLDAERGRRLRLARRLAGFRSAAAGAVPTKLHRSTVNGHERSLINFDMTTAKLYAAAFGCEPAWLLDGDMPTGYPSEVDQKIAELLNDHDLGEVEAAARLPAYRSQSRPMEKAPKDLQALSVAVGQALPEFEVTGLRHRLTDNNRTGQPALLQAWLIPKEFLNGVLRADAESCVMVAIPKRTNTGSFQGTPGDRLIVDTSVTEVFSATYALAAGDKLTIADARIEEGRRLAIAAARREDGLVLLGQIVGTVASVR